MTKGYFLEYTVENRIALLIKQITFSVKITVFHQKFIKTRKEGEKRAGTC